ncbi:MAG: DUF4442 domain-containing protein [Chitinophagaceae bacterium]
MFLLFKIPSAFFSGVRVREITEEKCAVTVPYKWFSQNPFRSTYFACLSMAGEMSTGSLAMLHVYQRQPAISMLVTKTEGTFFKKATGVTTFLCEEGKPIKDTIEKAVATGEPQTFVARTRGTNAQGELVAEFLITWSFKAKS